MVKAVAKFYAPNLEKDLVNAFAGSESKRFDAGPYLIKYTWSMGPQIDERMFIITAK
jgi:hypothetical protein